MASIVFESVSKALDQLGDRRFRKVILLGVGITLSALGAVFAAVFWGVGALIGGSLTLPLIGTINWAGSFASWSALLMMMVLSVFVMVPIAQAVQSLFLDQVSEAVEARYYPHLPAAPRTPLTVAIMDGLRALGLLIVANIAALALYVLFAPFAPFIFYAVNGVLLGREYFQVTALRRCSPETARRLRRENRSTVWLAGILMALPLTIPVVNLLVPVLGAATFTHLYHAITDKTASGQRNPDLRP